MQTLATQSSPPPPIQGVLKKKKPVESSPKKVSFQDSDSTLASRHASPELKPTQFSDRPVDLVVEPKKQDSLSTSSSNRIGPRRVFPQVPLVEDPASPVRQEGAQVQEPQATQQPRKTILGRLGEALRATGRFLGNIISFLLIGQRVFTGKSTPQDIDA